MHSLEGAKGRPELTETPLRLETKISVLPCRGGEGFLRRLFEPLGYEVVAKGYELDEKFPEWGASSYYSVVLRGHVRLQDLLTHIYVLIPVLDNEKHYWVGDDEVEKLLRHASGWLAAHPEKEEITNRYLKHRRDSLADAVAALEQAEGAVSDIAPLLARYRLREEASEKYT